MSLLLNTISYIKFIKLFSIFFSLRSLCIDFRVYKPSIVLFLIYGVYWIWNLPEDEFITNDTEIVVGDTIWYEDNTYDIAQKGDTIWYNDNTYDIVK